MGKIFRFFIRSSAFLRKEIFEVLRQPRLILTLVLGPFLILLLFGLGYRVEAQPVRALFVLDADSPFMARLEEFATQIHPLLRYEGVSDSFAQAQAKLKAGDVDLVVVLPEDPVASIRSSEPAVVELYHNEIDPFQVDYIEAFARIYIDEVNRRVLAEIAMQGQEESASVQETLSTTREQASQMRQALEAGNIEEARAHREELINSASLLAVTVGTSLQVLNSVEDRFGSGEESIAPLIEQLAVVQGQIRQLEQLGAGQEDYSAEIEQARRIEEEFARFENALGDFRSIDPGVLVSPFREDIKSVSKAPLRVSDFYVPSAIALLTQHLAVTFAALSIVREQEEGTMEVFQVSPLSPIEALLGKYTSYFTFAAVLLAILSALVVWGLNVPILGNWTNYALVLAALVFTSLGLGFVLSLLSSNTSQAVQYSMILLLASIFFSGFFLTLELLRPFVQVVSWLLPATYATQLLQNVMLRGVFGRDQLILLGTLTVMGLALFVLAWLLLRRKMARR